jgi:rhamnogalacturonyl hydrolase YesR
MNLFALLFMAPMATAAAEKYLARMADSWLLDNNASGPYWSYGRATLYNGFQAAYDLLGNDTLLEWYRSQIDDVLVAPNGTLLDDFNTTFYSLDDYRIGNNILYWYQRTEEERYRIAANTIRSMLNRHPRTPTGGFWHRNPSYPNQMWLDGIFMADNFYALWTSLFDKDNTTAWEDIVLQYDKIEAVCIDNATKLLVHGFDESKKAVWANPINGAAHLVWDRAVGWFFMSLVDVLQVYPKELSGYKRLLGYYTSLAEALRLAQDPDSHGWWLIMSEQYVGAEGNYFEASAAAMFTYGWLAGMRLGFIDEETYLTPALNAYQHLVDDFVVHNPNGTLTFTGTVQVGSLGSNATFEASTILLCSIKESPADHTITVLHEYPSG